MFAAGIVYKLYFISDAFYVQMQEVWGLTNTQIGVIYSVTGWISTFGFLISTYITERFSKKKLIPFSLIISGIAGLSLLTKPDFSVMLPIFCVFAVCSDMLFWPTMLKAVRLLGSGQEQGRMFGFLETGRGLLDTVINFAALGIFAALGGGMLGMNGSIIFFSALFLIIGIVSYFTLEDDEISSLGSNDVKNKHAFKEMAQSFKNPAVWLVAFNVFMVYCVYSGIRYFAPYMKEVFGISTVLASAYGIINSYVLKMVGGPIGGFVSDKVLHSPAKFIQLMFIPVAGILVILMMLPAGVSVYVAMIVALLISACIFCQRAVYFAPMDEVAPRESSGSAMALGSFIGYMPGAFMTLIYGTQLDAHPGAAGYKIVFTIMACLCAAGFVISAILVRYIKNKKAAEKAAANTVE